MEYQLTSSMQYIGQNRGLWEYTVDKDNILNKIEDYENEEENDNVHHNLQNHSVVASIWKLWGSTLKSCATDMY